MEQKEYLEKHGIPSIEYPEKKYNELKEQFLEMAQLKSDFDMEKFTIKKEGHFIAHNFHFLMRQYSLALSELRRMNIDKREKLRIIESLKSKDVSIITLNGETKYVDLEIERLKNEIDMLDLNLTNKLIMCDRFEKLRVKLIELNGGTAPTNKEYQTEEPEYWKWYLQRKALWQHQERVSGISEGVWENIEHLEQPAVINKKFQIMMTDKKGLFQLDQANQDVKTLKKEQSKPLNIEEPK